MDKLFAIFDMDGTLVDSMGHWQQLGREYLAQQGITQNVEPILERIKPMTILQSSELFIKEFGIQGTPAQVAAQMNAVMEHHYRTDVKLKPGVKAYLSRLQQQGVQMCVASATDEDLVRACLERLQVQDDFTFLLSCQAVGAGKDQPDVFFAAARRLGAAPGEIAVYEDAYYAAKTAKEAGFYVVGVYDACAKNKWEQLRAFTDETITSWQNAAQFI